MLGEVAEQRMAQRIRNQEFAGVLSQEPNGPTRVACSVKERKVGVCAWRPGEEVFVLKRRAGPRSLRGE